MVAIPEIFKQAVGVEQLTDTQKVIMFQLVQDCRDSKKLDVMDYLKRATQEVSDVKSLSSEDSASVSVQQTGNSVPRSHRSQMNDRIQSQLSDTATQSYAQTKSWVETLNPVSTKATSPSPFVGAGNVSSLSLPQTSEALPRAASLKKEPAPSTSGFSDLSDPPPLPKKADDSQSLSSALSSSKLSSVPSQNPFGELQESFIPNVARRKQLNYQKNSESGTEFDAVSSVKSSTESESNFSEDSGPKRKRRKLVPSRSNTKTAKRPGANKKLDTGKLSSNPQQNVDRMRPESINTAPSISIEELDSKMQELAEAPLVDHRDKQPKQYLKDPAIRRLILDNANKGTGYESIARSYNDSHLETPLKYDHLKLTFVHFNKYLGNKYGYYLGQKFKHEVLHQPVADFCDGRTDVTKEELYNEFRAAKKSEFPDLIQSFSLRSFLQAVRDHEAATGKVVGKKERAPRKQGDLTVMFDFAIKGAGKDCESVHEIYKLYKHRKIGTLSASSFHRNITGSPGNWRAMTVKEKNEYLNRG